jgi:DNA-binding response OmpR family regulator
MTTRILVADDDADIRKLVTFKMNQEGYDVTVAVDGDEAYALATESAYDLLLLDWQMPGRSGVELCEVLRARPEYARAPIIMLTARSLEKDLELAFDVGASGYITKPFRTRELATRVKAALRSVSL